MVIEAKNYGELQWHNLALGKEVKLLDIIEFSDRGSKRTFNAKITELSYFKNFRDAIKGVGIKKVLPNARSLPAVGMIRKNGQKEQGVGGMNEETLKYWLGGVMSLKVIYLYMMF